MCGKGKYSEAVGAVSCVECDEGKYSMAQGAVTYDTCVGCDAGTYLETKGNDAKGDCVMCGAGKYSNVTASPSSTTCLSCLSGKYSKTEGAVSNDTCFDCPAGQHAAGSASSACTPCAAGFFQAGVGNSKCTVCPANSISPSSSTGQQQCVCGVGFTGSSGGETCTACDAGSSKSEIGNQPCKENIVIEEEVVIEITPDFAPTDVIIKMVFGLPMSIDEFTPATQTSFKQALADAAGVVLQKVKIANIEAVTARRSRQLLAESIRIDVEVAMKDDSAAQAAIGNLTPEMINTQLQKVGLPQATILEAASVQLPAGAVSPSSTLMLIIGALAAVVLMGSVCLILSRRKQHALDLKLSEPLAFGREIRMAQADFIVPTDVVGNGKNSGSIVPSRALGLKWDEVGSKKPTTGSEIKNDKLASLLKGVKGQIVFTKEQFYKFNILHISTDSYIKAGDCYFKPAAGRGVFESAHSSGGWGQSNNLDRGAVVASSIVSSNLVYIGGNVGISSLGRFESARSPGRTGRSISAEITPDSIERGAVIASNSVSTNILRHPHM